MKYVLDASVAICWVIPRQHSPKALRLRDEYQRQIHELIAPAIFIDEVAGALPKAERQKAVNALTATGTTPMKLLALLWRFR